MLPEAMADPRQEAALAYLRRSQQAVERAAADGAFVAAIVAIADRIAAALKNGGKVLLAGNGGSASDAQHIAAELVGRLVDDRAPLAAIALTTDTSALTAIGNDYGFEQVFARQLRALGRKGDVFVALSTSGRSPNVIAALQAARELGLVTVGFSKDAPTPMHRAVRSRAGGAVRGDRADPADPHHRRRMRSAIWSSTSCSAPGGA